MSAISCDSHITVYGINNPFNMPEKNSCIYGPNGITFSPCPLCTFDCNSLVYTSITLFVLLIILIVLYFRK